MNVLCGHPLQHWSCSQENLMMQDVCDYYADGSYALWIFTGSSSDWSKCKISSLGALHKLLQISARSWSRQVWNWFRNVKSFYDKGSVDLVMDAIMVWWGSHKMVTRLNVMSKLHVMSNSACYIFKFQRDACMPFNISWQASTWCAYSFLHLQALIIFVIRFA